MSDHEIAGRLIVVFVGLIALFLWFIPSKKETEKLFNYVDDEYFERKRLLEANGNCVKPRKFNYKWC